jgi:predicted RNA-binding protein YlxR (DUF448 family)
MLTDEQRDLVEKNFRLGVWISGQVKKPMDFSHDEWMSECLWCLVRTVQHFDPAKGKFQTLLWRFVKTHKHNIVVKQKTRRRGGKSGFVSIDEEHCQGKVTLEDLLATKEGADQVEAKDFANWVYSQLDCRERRVLEGLVNDDSFAAIGAKIGVSHNAANGMASLVQHKIADQFPWETTSRPKCMECGGPVLTRTKACFCGKCLFKRRTIKQKEYFHAREIRGRKKAVAV